MVARTGFTKKDIAVVLVCALSVLASLGAIGSTGRRRAKEAVCLSNLHKWGVVWKSFTDDREGRFMSRDAAQTWWKETEPYYADRKMLLCPMAEVPRSQGARNPYAAWDYDDNEDDEYTYPPDYKGSYCINFWISDEDGDIGKVGSGVQAFWRSPNVRQAYTVPVMGDSNWKDADPLHVDEPPEHEQDLWQPNANEMKRFIVNRHSGYINMLFLDWSVRKVGIKEVYKLKWHREFDTNGLWTMAGGMWHDEWEKWGDGWLARFKDY